MSSIIENLKKFADENLHHGNLHGYAARDAAKKLLESWGDAISDGCDHKLAKDVDEVIAYLREFQLMAQAQLPIKNGGLGGVPAEVWKERLAEEFGASVYESQDLPGHFGYTNCKADAYLCEVEALAAAVSDYLGKD